MSSKDDIQSEIDRFNDMCAKEGNGIRAEVKTFDGYGDYLTTRDAADCGCLIVLKPETLRADLRWALNCHRAMRNNPGALVLADGQLARQGGECP